MQRHRQRSRLWAVAAALGLVAAGGAATTASAQTTGCSVNYSIASEWPGGFTANVSVTNLGGPLSSWTLTWTFGAGQQVTNAWNTNLTQNGGQVTARDAGYNASVGAGATVSFGFNGSWNGSNPAPTSFALNGTPCTGSPVTPPPSQPPPASQPPPSSQPPPTSQPPPGSSPTWGTALPPANAPTSQAYDLIVQNNNKGYAPKPGECSKEIHARYWTYGPDGKVYPTWHPPRDPSGCSFGHEHGDDPRNSDLFSETGWHPFGYTSEVMHDHMSEHSHRHEDHVGHKVLSVNNVNVIQGDNGTSFFPPSGTVIAVCDVLLKFHQGTHSPDAFTNNVHELLFHQRCTQNGQNIEVRYNAMIPLGRPGGFSPSECPGFGGAFINVAPPVPADSPSDTRSPGRLIAETSCVDAIRRGDIYYGPLNPGGRPFQVSDMDDFWFSDVRVTGPGLEFHLAPLFYVVHPSRYYDPALPNRLGRIVDLCYTGLNGGPQCDEVLRITQQTGERVQWDDPRSPFNGALREWRPGTFSVRNSGPTTIYTDVYGRNASTTPFPGSIEQYFSGNTSSSFYVRGTTRDYAANPADRVRAPN